MGGRIEKREGPAIEKPKRFPRQKKGNVEFGGNECFNTTGEEKRYVRKTIKARKYDSTGGGRLRERRLWRGGLKKLMISQETMQKKSLGGEGEPFGGGGLGPGREREKGSWGILSCQKRGPMEKGDKKKIGRGKKSCPWGGVYSISIREKSQQQREDKGRDIGKNQGQTGFVGHKNCTKKKKKVGGGKTKKADRTTISAIGGKKGKNAKKP